MVVRFRLIQCNLESTHRIKGVCDVHVQNHRTVQLGIDAKRFDWRTDINTRLETEYERICIRCADAVTSRQEHEAPTMIPNEMGGTIDSKCKIGLGLDPHESRANAKAFVTL